jgi:predicted NAD-dependent protein-ADP-ribosyltransferase YbiA (DUF1768 family)
VVIDNKTYASAVHFAYARLIANLIDIGELPGLETFDVNMVSLGNLVNIYNNIKRDWIEHNLKVNNEVAIGMKFEQHSTLIHLLMATGDVNLVWNDRSDPVLGVGNDDMGANNTGRLLEYVRDSYYETSLPNKLISSYGSIAKNVWTNSWMMSMAQDFKNTMLLIKKPETADLEAIYSTRGIPASPDADDTLSLHRAGLNDEQIAIAFPVIASMYIPMRTKTERTLMNEEAAAYFTTTNYKGKKKKLNADFEMAITRLEKVSKLIQLANGVDSQKFAMSILGNKQTSNRGDARWNRIYQWSH